MRGDFLSGKEKAQLYEESKKYVRRTRSAVGALLHNLYIGYGVINTFGKNTDFLIKGPVRVLEEKEIWEEYNIKKRDLERAKSRGLVEFREISESLEMHWTNRGYVQSLLEIVASNDEELPDGFVSIVSYDIPEYEKKARDRLRIQLKRAGFTMFQRSVWVHRYNVVAEFAEYIEELGLTEYVHVHASLIDTNLSRSRQIGKTPI
ncbi:CRISPR-associated endonuclease Cas2 [Candidatus Uhrbacteria bacterium]|nr:CRISPR-associated endonuclease Cas2 [Candidatus Uhrbacteria bacterium]